jgi:putative tryptophan/tyrosine transport system substrate-binding protein
MNNFIKSAVILILIFILSFASGCSKGKTAGSYQIGICLYTTNPLLESTRDGFLKALNDGGYLNNEKFILDIKNAQGDMATTQLIMQNFIQNDVNMICAISTPSLQSAINATQEIPIIFGAIANPYRIGAGQDSVNHLSNVTGASAPSPIREAMEMLQSILPDARKVGTLWNPAEENSHYDINRIRKIALELGLELVEMSVSSSSEVYMAAQALAEQRIDAYMQILDNVACSSFDSIVQAADKYQVPLFTLDTKYSESGACVTLGWDYFDNGYKSGELAIRVIQGENPADIPFQTLDKSKFFINLTACKRQGLTIPDSIMNNADKVIE